MDSLQVSLTDGSRATATSKIQRLVIIVNGWKPITVVTKYSILDVAESLDSPLSTVFFV